MSTRQDAALAYEFARRCEEARETLRGHMEARGLRAADGWRIHETSREGGGGTEIVMRPIHLHLEPPGDLECVVSIEGPGSSITTHCET